MTEIQASTNVVIELFYRGDSDQSLQGKEFLEQLRQRQTRESKLKPTMCWRIDVQLKRLWQLSKQFGHESGRAPTFYLCNNLVVGFRGPQTTGVQIEELLNIRAYIRPGCKHCKAGKAFLDKMILRKTGDQSLLLRRRGDLNARQEVQNLAARYQVQIPSFPCIQVAGRLVVGYQTDETTGKKIEDFFIDRSATAAAPEKTVPKDPSQPDETNVGTEPMRAKTGLFAASHPWLPRHELNCQSNADLAALGRFGNSSSS